MENIQDEVMKIHHKYGTTEMANYQIQLLFDRNYSQLQNRINELEEEKTTELIDKHSYSGLGTMSTKKVTECCGILANNINYCPNCGCKILR